MRQRQAIRVRGVVQGVGFRPHVHRIATLLGLSGSVRNDAQGVVIEVQGPPAALAAFRDVLGAEAPPLARIDGIEIAAMDLGPDQGGFTIGASVGGEGGATMIGPDVAVCPDCLAEMGDALDRRFGYAFLNCTNCGPRYTITARLPYDRVNTVMARFALCPACAAEYGDPADRRFHAQPTACPVCGPRLSMPVAEIAARLAAGDIVAVKGVGGFHLACDAAQAGAVATLRARKDRDEKPLAVMVADLDRAKDLALVDRTEAAILTGPARPIVLLRKSGPGGIGDLVAPGLNWIGVMLPYAPLHHLLFNALPAGAALVMTSANPKDEPLVIGNDEARARLAGIADAVADHDRDILVRVDDSVVRADPGGGAGFIRRARGFVPLAIPLPCPMPSVLALGGHLKNTVCVTRGAEAFPSQHVGDIETPAAARFLAETVDHLLNILAVTPKAVAHDLHPDFHATRLALEISDRLGVPAVAVQHHHAHIAAVMAEHGRTEPTLGLALDGFGLGDDGRAWGGELLLVDGRGGFERLGHLGLLPQPGGDAAARQPWRMAAAALHVLGRGDEAARLLSGRSGVEGVLEMLRRGVNCPETSSAGRLFDAACGLLGVKPVARFEGQAPMMLEGLVTTPEVLAGGWRIDGAGRVLDLLPLLGALAGMAAGQGADLFHGTLIRALAEWVEGAAERSGVRAVALGGGCFLNRVLSAGLRAELEDRGLEPLSALAVPPNDGGLSLGQAFVAGLRLGQ